jgi:Predicted membrane protein (DUF2306)
MLSVMSTEELSRSTPLADDHRLAARRLLLRRPWVAPLALLTVIFIGYAVPPYLTLDPARARIQPMPPDASYYPLLVIHIFLGSIALLAACLQVWPWVRRSHRAIHRWSGRVYVTAALIASVCVMIIAPMGQFGANQRLANTMLLCSGSAPRLPGSERSGNAAMPITANGCCAALHWPSPSSPIESG